MRRRVESLHHPGHFGCRRAVIAGITAAVFVHVATTGWAREDEESDPAGPNASAASTDPAGPNASAASTDPADAAARDRIMAAYKEYASRMDAGELAEALGPAKRAYDYAQADLTTADEELAITAYALGKLMLELGRPIDALRPLAHAQQCYEEQQGPLAPRALGALRRTAEANQALGRYETAELAYIDLVARYRKLEGDHTRALAGLDSRLTLLMLEAGIPTRARRYGLRSLKGYQQADGKDSLEVGLMSIQLARISFELEDYDEALDFLAFGTPVLEKQLEPGDPQLTKLYEYLVEVYAAAGDASRERRYRVRLKKNKQKTAELEEERKKREERQEKEGAESDA